MPKKPRSYYTRLANLGVNAQRKQKKLASDARHGPRRGGAASSASTLGADVVAPSQSAEPSLHGDIARPRSPSALVLENLARAEQRLQAVHARMGQTFGEIAHPTWAPSNVNQALAPSVTLRLWHRGQTAAEQPESPSGIPRK